MQFNFLEDNIFVISKTVVKTFGLKLKIILDIFHIIYFFGDFEIRIRENLIQF